MREQVEAHATSYDGDPSTDEWPPGLLEDLGAFRPAMTLHEALELGGAPTIPAEQYAAQLQRLAAAFPQELTEACPAQPPDCALGETPVPPGASLAHQQSPGEPTTECLASAAGCTGGGAPRAVLSVKPVNRTLVVLLGNARGGEETWLGLGF